MHQIPGPTDAEMRPLPDFIFVSRWLQLPLYLGPDPRAVRLRLPFLGRTRRT